MLGKIDLSTMKCPKCGNTPEINFRQRPVVGVVVIRCPYGCYRRSASCHIGSENLVRDKLVAEWRELLEQEQGK